MENLTAIFPQKNSVKHLSHEDFQEMLQSWLKKKGVLTELRLQLRFKLVNLLRDTVIGNETVQINTQCTLANQAINLIIAEYLMKNKCFYTLSLFNTEAVFSVLPQHPVLFNEGIDGNGSFNLHFDRENIYQIMGLLGLNKNSPCCDKLLNMYFNKPENRSILSCLIALIPEFPVVNIQENDDLKSSNIFEQTPTVDGDETNLMRKVEHFCHNTNLSIDNVNKICQLIKKYYVQKGELHKKEFVELINQQKTEIVSKDRKIKEIRKSESILRDQLRKVNKNCQKNKLHLTNLLNKEILNQNAVPKHNNTDFTNVKNNEKNFVETNILQTSNIENMRICELPHCNPICKENIKRNEELLNQNLILKKENEEQKEELRKFSLIYKDLLCKFNNCQDKLNYLNSTTNRRLDEDLLDDILYGKFIEVQVPKDTEGSDVNSESLTDEILRQAQTKLQKLEKETREIEDKFKTTLHCI